MTIINSNERQKNGGKKHFGGYWAFESLSTQAETSGNGTLWMSGFDLWLSLFTFSVEIIRKQMIYVLFSSVQVRKLLNREWQWYQLYWSFFNFFQLYFFIFIYLFFVCLCIYLFMCVV